MNKKSLVSMGLVFAISTALLPAFAADDNKIIYTDNLGRMHFLGRDASSNSGTKYNYTNPAEQELTRKLYSEDRKANYDSSFDQHPVKNYENTFPDSRFKTRNFWGDNYANNTEASRVDAANAKNVDTSKGIPVTPQRVNRKLKTNVSATGGGMYDANPYMKTEEGYKNVIKDKKTSKKHWWNKK